MWGTIYLINQKGNQNEKPIFTPLSNGSRLTVRFILETDEVAQK
jgi:hypothetical protein